MFKDQKAISFFSNDMLLTKLNADVDTLTVRKYRVTGYPTTVLMDKSGREVDRLVGYAEVDEFIETLLNYPKGIGTLADLLNQAESKEDRELYYKIARKYKYRSGSEEAENWYAKVIELGEPRDSLSGESRIAVADMYRRAKEYEESLAAFVTIAEEFKGSSFGMDADYYIAIVYRSMGNTTQAIAAYEKYVEKYPQSEDVDKARKNIERLKNPPREEDK